MEPIKKKARKKPKNRRVAKSIVKDAEQIENLELDLEYARCSVNEHAIAIRQLCKDIKLKAQSIV